MTARVRAGGPWAVRLALCLVVWSSSPGVAHAQSSVPPKDATRIAKVPAAVLGDTELVAHIGRVHSAVAVRVSADVSSAAKRMLPVLQQESSNRAALGNAAVGTWMLGQTELALVLMSEACAESKPNPDNLNNYAAFLTMAGAEQAALPILVKLDRQFPNNSTVLNNIGQAWFGLGDLEQAEKYLDQAIRAFAGHSQANLTKALIAQSRGDLPGAREAVRRSLREGYSTEKEVLLRKLGGKLEPADLPWRLPRKDDGLGLSRFHTPPFSKRMDQVKAVKREWDEFQAAIGGLLQAVKAKERTTCELAKNEEEARVRQIAEAARSGGRIPSHLLLPPFSLKAEKRWRATFTPLADAERRLDARKRETDREVKGKKSDFLRRLQAFEAKYSGPGKRTGEEGGGGTPDEVICAERRGITDPYLEEVNGLLEQRYKERLAFTRHKLDERVYWAQFLHVEDSRFECIKLEAKHEYLDMLYYSGHGEDGIPLCQVPDPAAIRAGALPDFYDVNCQFKTTLDMPFIGRIEVACNKMTTELGAGPLAVFLQENLDTEKIIRGTVEIGISKGLETSDLGWKGGPLKAELGASAAAFLEFDNKGITDLGIKAGLEASVGTDIMTAIDHELALDDGAPMELPVSGDQSISAGVGARYGVNSGGSLSGKGLLDGAL